MNSLSRILYPEKIRQKERARASPEEGVGAGGAMTSVTLRHAARPPPNAEPPPSHKSLFTILTKCSPIYIWNINHISPDASAIIAVGAKLYDV
ncbi:hypothetical protein EVAR_68676_1 [Eumeta japonica]|uniref:Uncharacterized protein n=1 Tax=Eumeta variegata TaxID=151549 RepID=A0A4C2AFJ7_EUMVA|nr:hypothetical protein EVAR_68676_1 [Eumeta japonica]